MIFNRFSYKQILLVSSFLTIILSIIFFLMLDPGNQINNVALEKLETLKKLKKNSTLVIGITSSPEHKRQRQSLRETWLSLLPESYDYCFLIGENICNIHPSDRVSPYSCESLNISLPTNATENTLIHSVRDSKLLGHGIEIVSGYSFLVQYPIIVHSLEIKRTALQRTKHRFLRVLLIDLATSSRLSSVTFDVNSNLSDAGEKGYIFKKPKYPVLLPKGFEGTIIVKGLLDNIDSSICNISSEWAHGNLISVFNIITHRPHVRDDKYCVLATFSFTINDVEELQTLLNDGPKRTAEWTKYTQQLSYQLEQERKQHNDIVLLRMTDVYRNLPQKVLLFLHWLSENYNTKYVLKTDDDTFIDILKVKAELEKMLGWEWWSCFRINWPVQKHGKWRETSYQQHWYPPFPTGAGYVLSEHVLAWLNTRMDSLSVSYQGEDVAMGIWLSDMNATRHDGTECYWACNEQCHTQTCNVMELSVEDVYKVWSSYKDCGNNICFCPGGS